jgi:HPr kinase/phosphorylase
MDRAPAHGTLHATAVAVDGRGLLITGASGSGKSSLAIALIGLGAKLISDDQTQLFAENGLITLSCPEPSLHGVIEARNVGLLRADASNSAPLALLVDLDRQETERLPPRRHVSVLGCEIDLVYGSISPTFPVALMLHLRHGRYA